MSAPFTPRELRDAFGTFATGVTVVTGVRPDGEPVGTTANSFTSVSLDPPLLLWCLASNSGSLPAFTAGRSFAVHVLAREQRDLAMHFARRVATKFDVDRHWRSNPTPPLVADTLCRFDCRVQAVHPGGDHVIIVGEILALSRHPGQPLAFHQGKFASVVQESGAPTLDIWEDRGGQWM